MCATFNGNSSTTTVSCNSPTNASVESGITTFYDGLFSLARYISKQNVLIIGGCMNALKEKNINDKFYLFNLPNRNGEYLADVSLENSFSYLNIKFHPQIIGTI